VAARRRYGHDGKRLEERGVRPSQVFGLKKAKATVRRVRFHDLRHTFASTAVAAGQGLPMIGKLLGHTQVQTTARYAHLAADPVKVAADNVAAEISACLNRAA
jgi:integrase